MPGLRRGPGIPPRPFIARERKVQETVFKTLRQSVPGIGGSLSIFLQRKHKDNTLHLWGMSRVEHETAVQQKLTERYLLNELDVDARNEFEEHFFDCPECAFDVQAGV